MRIRILYHENCFDGAASAAVLSRFLKDCFFRRARFLYTGLCHTAHPGWNTALFDGDQNAIVDFRYSCHPRLTWWFDHHQSAFLTAADEDHYRQDRSGRKILDPSFQSCTNLIATYANAEYGYCAPDLKNLIHWADVIDGAQYERLEEAVEMQSAAAKLALVIEHSDHTMVECLIRKMQAASLEEILAEPPVRSLFDQFHRTYLQSADLIRRAGRLYDRVLLLDLTRSGLERFNKFLPYFLFPGSTYCVAVTQGSAWTKISLGSNSWAGETGRHNLARLAERYGGGGHAAVAGISFADRTPDRALGVALEIAAELAEPAHAQIDGR
jgi:hypothetical protein